MGFFRKEDKDEVKAKRTVYVCPDCEGTNVEYGLWSGTLTHSYHCHDCGFEGMIVLELDMDEDQESPG